MKTIFIILILTVFLSIPCFGGSIDSYKDSDGNTVYYGNGDRSEGSAGYIPDNLRLTDGIWKARQNYDYEVQRQKSENKMRAKNKALEPFRKDQEKDAMLKLARKTYNEQCQKGRDLCLADPKKNHDVCMSVKRYCQ